MAYPPFVSKFSEPSTVKNFPPKLSTCSFEAALTSVAETTLKLRSDEVKSKDIREQIIKNSPQDNEDYFVVPKVIE